MVKHFIFPIVLLVLVTSACGGSSSSPTPASPVVVVTATAESSLPTLPPVTPSPSGDEPTAAANDSQPTNVDSITAKTAVNVRRAPSTEGEVVGQIYPGQTATVMGKSADGQWWHIACPSGLGDECWVSADPELTEASTTGDGNPAATLAPPQSESDTFVRELSAALNTRAYDALREIMGDPFTVGYWQSEGTNPTREEAITLLKNVYVGPAGELAFDLAGTTDQTELLGGKDPRTMWDPSVDVVRSLLVKGFGADRKGEALLIIAKRPDDSLYWYGMLVAAGGFKQ